MVTLTLWPGDKFPLAGVNLAVLSLRVNQCKGFPELTVSVKVTWQIHVKAPLWGPLQLIPSPGIPTFFGTTFRVGLPVAASAGKLATPKTRARLKSVANTHRKRGMRAWREVCTREGSWSSDRRKGCNLNSFLLTWSSNTVSLLYLPEAYWDKRMMSIDRITDTR